MVDEGVGAHSSIYIEEEVDKLTLFMAWKLLGMLELIVGWLFWTIKHTTNDSSLQCNVSLNMGFVRHDQANDGWNVALSLSYTASKVVCKTDWDIQIYI